MKNRERMLAMAVGTLVSLFLLYLIVNGLLFSPAAKLDRDTAELAEKVENLRRTRDILQTQAGRLRKLSARMLGGEADRTSERLSARLGKLLQRSGLGGETMSLAPSAGSRMKDYYREIGWIVRDEGEIERVLDFLYLLSTEPYVHRIETLMLTPIPQSGQVKFQLRFATLAVASPKGMKLTYGQFGEADRASDLASQGRKQYDVILKRDLFRPYKRHVAAAPPKPRPPRPDPTPPVKPPAPREQGRVVSLGKWAGKPQVHVRNTTTNEVKRYSPGETLAGGKIVMIDYRPLPSGDKPMVLSPSRVILKVKSEYWAVELGQELSKKRRLSKADCPDELKEKSQ